MQYFKVSHWSKADKHFPLVDWLVCSLYAGRLRLDHLFASIDEVENLCSIESFGRSVFIARALLVISRMFVIEYKKSYQVVSRVIIWHNELKMVVWLVIIIFIVRFRAWNPTIEVYFLFLPKFSGNGKAGINQLILT